MTSRHPFFARSSGRIQKDFAGSRLVAGSQLIHKTVGKNCAAGERIDVVQIFAGDRVVARLLDDAKLTKLRS